MHFRKVRSRKQFVPSRNPGLRCKAVDRNLRLRGFQEQEKLRSNRVEWMKWLVFAVMLIPWPVFRRTGLHQRNTSGRRRGDTTCMFSIVWWNCFALFTFQINESTDTIEVRLFSLR